MPVDHGNLITSDMDRNIVRAPSTTDTPVDVATPSKEPISPSGSSGSVTKETLVDRASMAPPTQTAPFKFMNPPEAPDEIGRLGGYRVLRLLGQGGMAFVFLAEDLQLHRRVALKVMRPELAGDTAASQRFLREARSVAAVKHDNVVTVYQVGQDGRASYLAMEWLQGNTLDDWLQKHVSPRPSELVRLAKELAQGLAAIHRHGLVHRDLKPNNIWIEEPNHRAKLLDFGLARRIEEDLRYTGTGFIVGTPAFMSPEQARGEHVDERSDLFSLGGVFYFLCSGQLPFRANTPMGMLTALAVDTPVPITEMNPDLPQPLAELIARLMSKKAEDRPASAQDVVEILEAIEKGQTAAPTPARGDATVRIVVEPSGGSGQLAEEKPNRAMAIICAVTGLAVGVALFAASGAFSNKTPGNEPGKLDGLPKRAVAENQPSVTETPLPRPGVQDAASVEPRATVLVPKVEKLPTANVKGMDEPLKPPPFRAPPVLGPPLKKEPVKVEPPAPVFLSQLKPFGTSNWIKEPPPPPPEHGVAAPKDFPGVCVNGHPSPHGLFMHGPFDQGARAYVIYRLERQYAQFRTEVSLNDGPGEAGSPMRFSVYGDGKLLWQSRSVKTRADRQKCEVGIKGVDMLTLEVTCGEDHRGTHGAWIEPQINR